MAVVPVAKAMYLCDYHIGYSNGKVDLYGLFNAIRPEKGFPYSRGRFCVFAQLINGQGQVPFFIDVRFAETDVLVYTTETRNLIFPDQTTIVQLALAIEGCQFQSPGLYLLELFCDNTWVCDTPLLFALAPGGNDMNPSGLDGDSAAETFQDGTAAVQAFTSPAIPVLSGSALESRQGRPARVRGQEEKSVDAEEIGVRSLFGQQEPDKEFIPSPRPTAAESP